MPDHLVSGVHNRMKRIIKNRIVIFACVMLLAALLSGCGSAPENGPAAEQNTGNNTEETAEAADTGNDTEETAEAADTEDAGNDTEETAEVTDTADNGQDEQGADNGNALSDGVYSMSVELSGGTGKAGVESPCEVRIENGKATAVVQWSSPHYDFMIVDGETYDPVNTDGNSRFEIPVVIGEEMAVQADTTAMSQPHLIDYTLLFTAESSEETADASEEEAADTPEEDTGSAGGDTGKTAMTAPEIPGLTYEAEMEKQYAKDFSVFYYEGGYKVLAASSGRQYLLVPEGGSVPGDVPEGMIVLQNPPDRIYLAASSAMALFHALDALDRIAFSGTEPDGWYIEEAAEAMNAGQIAFAGKYSQPDYEGLLAGGCDLAVESTMILHTPEVQEKLEKLGIPVLIDESSHESHPLGRTEWIRFYGALLDKEEEADAFFATQSAIIEELEGTESTGKTVAYFFVNNAGNAVVRRTDDYIPGMIELAGGVYAFQDLQNPNPDSTSGSVTLSVEEFYAQAKDCDYLIYNAAIDDPLKSVADLIDKGSVFADFKAVKEDHVYTTDKYMYQATDIMGELIRDIHKMLTGSDDSDMLFLKHVSE